MEATSVFVRKKGGPKLKGRAAQVAALAEPMLDLWQSFMDPADPAHKQIKTWLKMNVLTGKILKNNADNFGSVRAGLLQLQKVELCNGSSTPFLGATLW